MVENFQSTVQVLASVTKILAQEATWSLKAVCVCVY